MTLCGEGSNASSTNKESNLSQSSRERRNTDTQSERKLRRSEGSSMLIDDPLGEGSKASSTDSKLWRTEHSFPRMRGNSDAHKGAACS